MRTGFILIICLVAFAAKSQSVYKTPSGSKYHLSTCRMVKNVSAEISAEEAKRLGLQPGKFCKPQNIYAAGIPSPLKAQGQNNTVQCKGYTKAGTRCKHQTSIGNGFCYQHQPK
ncbi:MAG TPA: DUF5763 domain-containing protein [Panacibacter sp.]|nr:DUF5763 domain-containing protein [Panacibacter sp.]